MKKKLVMGTLLSALLVGSSCIPANAASLPGSPQISPLTASSSVAYFDDGATITANMWIQTIASSGGCGAFQSSAVVSKTANWVKDAVSFHANGIGAAISGGSITGSGADASASITNTNTTGAYISGTVCVNWLTWYLSATTTASALHYGNVRLATASV